MFIGKEALQKLLRQTRVMYSNGYDTFFWKQGGYEQALRDFQSIDPKLLNGNRHKVGFNSDMSLPNYCWMSLNIY